VLDHLRIEHFEAWNKTSIAAVECRAGGGARWIVNNCLVQYNAPRGISTCDGINVTNNIVRHNGMSGIAGGADGATITGNHVYANADTDFYEPGFGSAGIKIVGKGHRVQNNDVRDNHGSGIWFDVNSEDAQILDNVVEDNERQGIMYEISCGSLVVAGNQVRRNGFGRANGAGYAAGIFISSSGPSTGDEFQIHDNVVENNANGISILQQDRPHCGTLTMKNIKAYDNVVRMSTADVPDVGGAHARTGFWGVNDPTNDFFHNTYYLHPSTGDFFHITANLTKSQWQAAGQDQNGTFIGY
jgi:hypothetical protein